MVLSVEVSLKACILSNDTVSRYSWTNIFTNFIYISEKLSRNSGFGIATFQLPDRGYFKDSD